MARTATSEATIRLGNRWRAVRDSLLASPRFQRWAAAFPLTRPIARRRAADLFDICAGFVYSQVLVACVRLRLFQQLKQGSLDVPTLVARSSVPPEAMTMLLEAAAALRLLEKRQGQRFGLGPLGAAMLGNPGIAAMVEHHCALYEDLVDPVALLRGEVADRRLSSYWPYARAEAGQELGHEAVSPYTALMSASQPMVAEMVLGAYSFARHRCLLDIGGGDGSFLIAAGRAAPDLKLQLFDLPQVSAIAHDRLAAAGMAARSTAIAGNFARDPLPVGADIVSLIRVVHDHDDDVVLALFSAIRALLPAKGTLLIGEPMSGQANPDPVGAYFGMYLFAMGSGRPRSFAALSGLLQKAGFADVTFRRTRIPMIASVAVARC